MASARHGGREKNKLATLTHSRGTYRSCSGHCKTGHKGYGGGGGGGSPQEECDSCIGDPKALLPNPKYLSEKLLQETKLEDRYITSMFVLFGQFVDHDLTLTPEFKARKKIINI